mgnify:CR=1 FL=1
MKTVFLHQKFSFFLPFFTANFEIKKKIFWKKIGLKKQKKWCKKTNNWSKKTKNWSKKIGVTNLV